MLCIADSPALFELKNSSVAKPVCWRIKPSTPGTAITIPDAVAYIDTLALFCWNRLPDGVLSDLRKRYKQRLFVKKYPVLVATLPRRRWRNYWIITIHQPKESTLKFLKTIQRGTFKVHAVHVAVDFLTPDRRQARLATDYLTHVVVLKWRGRWHRSHLKLNTAYWNVDKKAKRNIAVYGDKLSKTGKGPCCHFEIRFTSAAACKRARLSDVDSLIRRVADPMWLLNRQASIKIVDPKCLDRAVEKFAQQNVRRHRPNKSVDQVKRELQRRLARILQDDDHLNGSTLAKARSQNLSDHCRWLRHCLKPIPWKHFTPPPRWHRWR